MANRSMLFTCDKIPSKEKRDQCRARTLGEFNWSIPPVFKILVSANPVIADSLVWKEAKSVAGGYKEGYDRLFRFLHFLKEHKLLDDAEELEEKLEDCGMVLENARKDYFVLEPAEILTMDSTDILEATEAFLGKEIIRFWEDLEKLMDNYGNNKNMLSDEKYEWIKNTCSTWENDLGVSVFF